MRRLAALAFLGFGLAVAGPAHSDRVVGPDDIDLAEPGIRLKIGHKATATRLSEVAPGLVEVLVRGTKVDLRARLEGRDTPEISAMSAYRQGNNAWFLRVRMHNKRYTVHAAMDGDTLVLTPTLRTQPLRRPSGAQELRALLADRSPPGEAAPVQPGIRPLGGDAMAGGVLASSHSLLNPPRPPWVAQASWAEVDRARADMTQAPTESARTRARFALGWHYLDLGFAAEGRHYLRSISARPGPISGIERSLARARAALERRRWDEAREELAEAFAVGADPAWVVEGLALVSLATHTPDRSMAARVLVAHTSRPEAVLLAADLLQREGQFAETVGLLERLEGQLEGESEQRRALRLGDALAMSGQPDAARRAWGAGPESLVEVRTKLSDLLTQASGNWPPIRAELGIIERRGGRQGAEALYLAAQVDLLLGSREEAIVSLGHLLRRHPRQVEGSDVPALGWMAYAGRVDELHSRGAWLDLAALHEDTWDPSMLPQVDDPAVLLAAADGYQRSGFDQRALGVLGDAFSAEIALDRLSATTAMRLAAAYADLGHAKDGLATLAWVRKHRLPADRGSVSLLESRLHASAGDHAAAAKALRSAAQHPDTRAEAELGLAMADAEAGRCRQAVPALERILAAAGDDAPADQPGPWLALARCQAAQGAAVAAASSAREAAGRTSSEEEARYAVWLAARVGGWQDKQDVDAARTGEDIWAQMAREQADALEFEQALAQRRVQSWPVQK